MKDAHHLIINTNIFHGFVESIVYAVASSNVKFTNNILSLSDKRKIASASPPPN